MWMLPIIDRICTAVIRIYYRFETSGPSLPESGPVILVANHPNGIVDAICVVAAARRPVRFLAKKPLFDHPLIGFLVRGSGAIPVYRKQDFPDTEVDNQKMFEAAFRAIAEGSTLGLFPEGISHDMPSLSMLKTGAARIALGADRSSGAEIAIVPVGLNIREKERFRSRALAMLGGPVEWADLGQRDASDAEAVRELTERIDQALREVTINLEQWEDARLVEYAEAIWSAEHGVDADVRHEARIEVTRTLARLRTDDPSSIQNVVQSIEEYAKLMEALDLRPRHLDQEPSLGPALSWVAHKIVQLGLSVPVLAMGYAVYLVPYLAVMAVDRLLQTSRDVRSTIKLFAGIFFYIPWIGVLSTLVGWRAGWPWGLATLAGLPLLGMATQLLRERWGQAALAVRRYFALRKSSMRLRLLERRRAIAHELDGLRQMVREN